MAYSNPLSIPGGGSRRKVSFSDVVVTSLRVEKTNAQIAESPRLYRDEINLEERPNESPVDESGNPIMVYLIESTEDELIRHTPLVQEKTDPVFGIKLGMLKQATEYRMEFTLPDKLPPGEVEMLRYVPSLLGHAELPVNLTAKVELIYCEKSVCEPGHKLVLKVSTNRQTQIEEFFTLRLVNQPSQRVHMILYGLSLGRGQGTPFLRSGIHRIGHNPDFDDSDEFTEWRGFANANGDDELPDGPSSNPSDAIFPQEDWWSTLGALFKFPMFIRPLRPPLLHESPLLSVPNLTC